MLYVKIARDGTIIGAEAHEHPVYINHPYYSQIPLRCEIGAAQGILSLDQKQIYHLLGKVDLPGDYLEAEQISEEEYNYLKEKLDPDVEPEPEPSPDDEDPGSDIMTPQQMRERIIDLEAENAEFRKNAEKMDRRLSNAEGALIEVINDLMSGDSGDGDDY